MATVRSQFISGFSWNTLTVVLQVVVQLIYTWFLHRLIPESSFGMMGIVLSIMGFAEIFSQIGIGPAIVQRKETDQGHLNAAFYSSLVLGALFTLGFVACATLIARFYSMNELELIIQVVCSSFTISALAVVPRSLMIKQMRFKTFFKASMISIVGGNLVVGLLLAYLGYGVWAYVWALFAQNALMTIAFWIYQPVRVSASWSWLHTRELMNYGIGSTLFNALNYAATRIDVILVPFFNQRIPGITSGDAIRQASMYERGAYVMSLPITIIGKLSDNVLFSGMAKIQDEDERLRRTILVATNFLASVSVPACVFVIVFAGELVKFYMTEKFNEVIPILQVLMAAVVFRTLSRLGDSLLRAKAALYSGTWIKAFYLLLMALGIIFTIGYGLKWVALSVVVATAIHYLMNMWLTSKLIGLSVTKSLISLLPSLLLGSLMCITALIAKSAFIHFQFPALVSFMLGALVCFSVVFTVICLFPKILGGKYVNPLWLAPDKARSIPIIKWLFTRLGN